jgi:D-3-phosphoglycerate dehydrogenase
VTAALDRPGIAFLKRGPCKTEEGLRSALQDADVSICGSELYTRAVLASAPRLRGVVRTGVGVDNIDLEAATEFGITVIHFPRFCTREVANHAIVLIMACAKRIVQLDRSLRTDGWAASLALRWPMGTIHGQTIGLLGFGNIARAVAVRAHCLEMDVIAYDPYVDKDLFAEYGVESVSLEEVAARSDYVSCHLPLTVETRGMLDATFFQAMKPTAYFVNTCRGPVVVEADLTTALREQQIAGAGLDVYEFEPIGPDHPFTVMDNVVLTPHTASSADETFRRLYRQIGPAVITLLEGGVPNTVANPDVIDHRRIDPTLQ